MYEDIVRRINTCLTGKENFEDIKKLAIQLPMLVRVNGVYPTLVYLDEKKGSNNKDHIKFFAHFISLSIEEMKLDIQKSNSKYEMYRYLIWVNQIVNLVDVKQLAKKEDKNDVNKIKNYSNNGKGYSDFLSSNNMKYRMDYGVEAIWSFDKRKKIKKPQKRLKISSIKTKKDKPYSFNKDKDLFCSLLRSKNEAIDHYNKLLGQPNLKREATVDTKLIIGMGEPSVREISMKLDHLTGLPYIPSSTIKGAFRSYLEFELEDKAVAEGVITRLFGYENKEEQINQDELTEKRGALIFWDAYPSESQLDKLRIDNDGFTSMTGRVVPIDMLSVQKGAVFQFRITYSPLSAEDSLTKDWDIVAKYFKTFINTVAFGSKKSVGYGLFKVNEEGKYGSK